MERDIIYYRYLREAEAKEPTREEIEAAREADRKEQSMIDESIAAEQRERARKRAEFEAELMENSKWHRKLINLAKNHTIATVGVSVVVVVAIGAFIYWLASKK